MRKKKIKTTRITNDLIIRDGYKAYIAAENAKREHKNVELTESRHTAFQDAIRRLNLVEQYQQYAQEKETDHANS